MEESKYDATVKKQFPYLRKKLKGEREYLITKFLGAGAYGVVYKAVTTKGDPPLEVAVKIFKKKDMFDEAKQKNNLHKLFDKEVEIYRRLSHPRIISVFEKIESGTSYYLIMQYCQQGDLEKWVSQKGPLPEREAVNAMCQITKAMECLRRHQIVHRDIKPENILMHNGEYILADFGISTSDLEMGTGGNFLTMAPEHYVPTENHQANSTSDIYSLGVTFYYMLYKDWPVDASGDFFKNKTTVVGELIPFPGKIQVSEPVKALLRRMIQLQQDRIGWADYFIEVEKVFQSVWNRPFRLGEDLSQPYEPSTPPKPAQEEIPLELFIDARLAPQQLTEPTDASMFEELRKLRLEQPPEPPSGQQTNNLQIHQLFGSMVQMIEPICRGRTGDFQETARFGFWLKYSQKRLDNLNSKLQVCMKLKELSPGSIHVLAVACLGFRILLDETIREDRIMTGMETVQGAPAFAEMAISASKLDALGELVINITVLSSESNKELAEAANGKLTKVLALLEEKNLNLDEAHKSVNELWKFIEMPDNLEHKLKLTLQKFKEMFTNEQTKLVELTNNRTV